jgi:hypothetical protein
MRICGYFSKPKGVREQSSLGTIVLGSLATVSAFEDLKFVNVVVSSVHWNYCSGDLFNVWQTDRN